MNIGLVHEFLVTWGGSDLVVRTFAELFPDAPLFTALYDSKVMDKHFKKTNIITSSLQKYPFALKKHRMYMPFFPIVFEQFDLSEYDVVLSSHHFAAKGVVTPADTCHFSFVHTPFRYAWDFYHDYARGFGRLSGPALRLLFHYLRLWDAASANRVDFFIANSHNTARRIWKHYRRPSEVIHSPIEAHRFHIGEGKGDYYLIVSRLVPYKRVDLAVEAFRGMNEKLLVAGAGPELNRLKAAAGPNVEFLGFVPDDQLPELYANCRAFLFPGCEDFGLTPIEAQAAGRPVIAYAKGGALETVIEGKTGTFFQEQTPEALREALKRFDPFTAAPRDIRHHALQFDTGVFKDKIHSFITEKYEQWRETPRDN